MRRPLLAVLLLLAPLLTGRAAEHVPAGPPESTVVFSGGCFWGIEAVFEHVNGVRSATSGYAEGRGDAPTYAQVSRGLTGHAEVVRVVYNPAEVSFEGLLRVFFLVSHDPTQRNRQGPDVGTQYRSAVFYSDDAQRRATETFVATLVAARTFPRPIVTEIVPLYTFHRAEEYHQNYAARHPDQPYIVAHDAPKVERLRRQMPGLYRNTER